MSVARPLLLRVLLRVMWLACCGVLPAIAPAIAIADEINCPSTLQETPTATSDDSRWVLVLPSSRKSLERVSMYLGNPPELSKTVPASTRKAVGATQTLTWDLLRSASATYWVGCTYANTTAMLFRRVDSSASRCVANFDVARGGEPQFNSMVCK